MAVAPKQWPPLSARPSHCREISDSVNSLRKSYSFLNGVGKKRHKLSSWKPRLLPSYHRGSHFESHLAFCGHSPDWAVSPTLTTGSARSRRRPLCLPGTLSRVGMGVADCGSAVKRCSIRPWTPKRGSPGGVNIRSPRNGDCAVGVSPGAPPRSDEGTAQASCNKPDQANNSLVDNTQSPGSALSPSRYRIAQLTRFRCAKPKKDVG